MDSKESDQTTVGGDVCHHENRVIWNSYANKDGSRTLRYQCKDCGHKWTVGPGRKGLKPEQVAQVLAASRTISNVELAKQFGVSRETIRQLRTGRTWKNVDPDQERLRAGRLCYDCTFYVNERGCGMGFPDFDVAGPRFANDCEAYAKRNDL
jgi:hypothetical protein